MTIPETCPKCGEKMFNEVVEWKCPKCGYTLCIEPEYCPPDRGKKRRTGSQ